MLRRLSAPFALLLLLVTTACGTPAVRIDDLWFDGNADFGAMRSFSVQPIETSIEVSESLARDTENAIREHLTARGYQEAGSAPDFVVKTEIEFATIYNTRTVGRTAGAAVSFTVSSGERNIELWRAVGFAKKADKTVTRGARIRQAVDAALGRFPPDDD